MKYLVVFIVFSSLMLNGCTENQITSKKVLFCFNYNDVFLDINNSFFLIPNYLNGKSNDIKIFIPEKWNDEENGSIEYYTPDKFHDIQFNVDITIKDFHKCDSKHNDSIIYEFNSLKYIQPYARTLLFESKTSNISSETYFSFSDSNYYFNFTENNGSKRRVKIDFEDYQTLTTNSNLEFSFYYDILIHYDGITDIFDDKNVSILIKK